MAKHKSATEVTVVTEERSAIQRWVDRNWGKAAVVGLIVAGAILFMQHRSTQEAKAQGEAWLPLLNAEGDVAKTLAAADAAGDSNVKGWGLALAAATAANEDNMEEAGKALRSLESVQGHILNSGMFSLPGNPTKTLAQAAASAIEDQNAWEAAHHDILFNPDPAAGSPW
ncbi:MAG: hypothetical protein R3E96_09355 [Planctomycetota bacterium]